MQKKIGPLKTQEEVWRALLDGKKLRPNFWPEGYIYLKDGFAVNSLKQKMCGWSFNNPEEFQVIE